MFSLFNIRKKSHKVILIIVLLSCVALALTSCGQQGPLYLPAER